MQHFREVPSYRDFSRPFWNVSIVVKCLALFSQLSAGIWAQVGRGSNVFGLSETSHVDCWLSVVGEDCDCDWLKRVGLIVGILIMILTEHEMVADSLSRRCCMVASAWKGHVKYSKVAVACRLRSHSFSLPFKWKHLLKCCHRFKITFGIYHE